MYTKGVNLGNWLVLEKWMNPVLFDGLEYQNTPLADEYDLAHFAPECEKLTRLKAHRESYITLEDFMRIKSWGMNSVRLPVPFFVFGDYPPYVGCLEYVDRALDWAQVCGLSVLIDVHTAPDSQNSFDNGGTSGVCKWHLKPENINFSISVLERLALRYARHKALCGIQFLNEPISDELLSLIAGRYVPRDPAYAEGSCGVPLEVLFDFYTRAYTAMRRHMDTDKAAVFHDGFRLKVWKDFMRGPEYKNVILDTHIYPGMVGAGGALELYSVILTKHTADIREMMDFFPVIVGEWSLCHPPALTQNQSPDSVSRLMRMLADAQLHAWSAGSGWYFWSYKVPSGASGWDARACVENRWLII
jgi:aryl-phospho-beta-D-glucosidase BglC (GH1 family)